MSLELAYQHKESRILESSDPAFLSFSRSHPEKRALGNSADICLGSEHVKCPTDLCIARQFPNPYGRIDYHG
jgi:hypothetical protein